MSKPATVLRRIQAAEVARRLDEPRLFIQVVSGDGPFAICRG